MLYYLIPLSIIHFCHPQTNVNRKRGDFDDLSLVQASPILTFYKVQKVWPTTNTTSNNSDISKGACQALHKPSHWIAHGLWPHKNSGKSPRTCKKNFDIKLIDDSLLQRLDEQWPSFSPGKRANGLWKFEWDKHGSCSTNIPSLKTIPKYFNKTLELVNHYNIGPILDRYRITPGLSISLYQMYNILRNSLSREITIRCFIDQNTGKQYFFEVEMCINKETMKLHNCHRYGIYGCNHNKLAIYATIERN